MQKDCSIRWQADSLLNEVKKMNLQRKIDNDTITFFSDEKKLFWIKENLTDNNITVSIGGELLSQTTHEFLDEMLAFVSVGLDIVIDFSEVIYIASTYMKALLEIQIAIDKKKKGSLCLKKIPPKILSELDKTGISELLYIE